MAGQIDPRDVFRKLSRRYRTPSSVQEFLRRLPYNREEGGETCRSAASALRAGRAHCLEAAFIAAAILENHGYPPTVMSLESQDNLDHVVYVFRGRSGWGAIARSRDEGLNGRAPVFRSLRDLAWSYFDPYVDDTGKVTGYGSANLDDSLSRWRDSPRNVWKAEQFLIDLKHRDLPSSRARYEKLLGLYREQGAPERGRHWW